MPFLPHMQMQTNHISHFLLTREVFPLLEKAAEQRGEARIVNHSSMARKGKPLDAKYLGQNGGNLGVWTDGCCWKIDVAVASVTASAGASRYQN